MGKRLIQQRRGSGTKVYRAPSFRYPGKAKYLNKDEEVFEIVDIIKSAGHNAPLIEVKSEEGKKSLLVAPEGVKVGQKIILSSEAEASNGNIKTLGEIPPGTPVFNIESTPGDGGKFVRSSGTFAKIISKTDKGVKIVLPSKKVKVFNSKCKATIGIVAGGGRKEKPFYKAGRKYFKMKLKNKLWPRVGATSMNAVDHPFGGTTSSHKGKPLTAPKNAPPGRKVGKIRARRTGRKKGKTKIKR